MSDLASLEDAFRAILDRAEGGAGDGAAILSAEDAPAAFGAAIAATVLPRRVTLLAGEAALSVVARNRRVIRVEEARPEGLCPETDAQDEGFAASFVAAILTVAKEGDARIETGMVDGPLPASALAGYSAAALAADIEAARDADGAQGDPVADFLAACEGHARAWHGAEPGVDVPEGATVDAAWLGARLEEWATYGPDDGIRLIVAEGGTPAALALVRRGTERCVVACAEARDVPALEAALAALNDRPKEG